MMLSRPLSSIHRSGLLTLPTMTYTGMQGPGLFSKSQILNMPGRDKE